MKTLGRILIILVIMALVMGITYAAVSASGSSASSGMEPRFEEGGRPPFPEGERFEGERHEERGEGGWMFGFIKNVGVIAVVTTLIVLPKSIVRKRKRTLAAG